MPHLPYNPEIPHDENHPCMTCDYQAKYANIILLQQQLSQMPVDSPQHNQLELTIEQEKVNLLNFGNYIAEQRCMGNYMAAMALYN